MFVFILLLKLVLVASKISIKGTNVGKIAEGDISLIFFVSISNDDCKKYHVYTEHSRCIEQVSAGDQDHEMVSLVGGYMGLLDDNQTKSISLIAPSLYLNNRVGQCTVQLKFVDLDGNCEYSAAVINYNTQICDPRKQCETVDLDYKDGCYPVDCQIKYLGTRNYFSHRWLRCQKVPVCVFDNKKPIPDVIYSPYSNLCLDSSHLVTKKDLQALEGGDARFTNDTILKVNSRCHNGKTSSDGETCKCYNGWTSSPETDYYIPGLSIYHMCNIQQIAWYEANLANVGITLITIGIIAVLMVICIVFSSCMLHLTYNICAQPAPPEEYPEDVMVEENLGEYEGEGEGEE